MIKTSKKCKNEDLRNKGYNGVIDSDFLKFIDNLHCRADNLKKDFEYIERELSKNKDLKV